MLLRSAEGRFGGQAGEGGDDYRSASAGSVGLGDRQADGLDRKTVRRYIDRGVEPRAYGPRKPRMTLLDPFTDYLRERVSACPGLRGARLLRELRERGYPGGYTAVTDYLRDVRPPTDPRFEVRCETAPGEQGQVDFAHFQVVFADEPTTPRIVWLFSMVLGYSRLIWAQFVVHQDLATALRCHVAVPWNWKPPAPSAAARAA